MKLRDAQRSLLKAKEAANERLRQLDEERLEIKASVRSLEAAIRALDGNRNRSAKPNAKKAHEAAASDPDDGAPESH